MEKYWQIFEGGYTGYANYLWNEITSPNWKNYFYWLIGVSLFFFLLEVIKPWRKNQPKFRKNFWQDAFYMFFNFFLFSLIIYNAASEVFVNLFKDFLAIFGIQNLVAIQVNKFPIWGQLFLLFIIRDFIQWWVHRLLHRVPLFWKYHKVHHSVTQMGFAAHLRYHWMENVLYKPLKTFGVMILGGFEPEQAFIVHFVAIAIGHFNHSN
ncbi:MAG: sterol desaturase family protein, partial [Flammeovirgaceae bacterium]|nr:sterol desaturase family protein [Flammeovirgaceae bacterium]